MPALTKPALLLALVAFLAPEVPAQRSARGPAARRGAVTTTQIHYRSERDFDRYRRATTVCTPRRVWIPGHHEWRTREVVVPGAVRRVWVPARYETRYDPCGRAYRVCVSAGYWDRICEPDRVEHRRTRVWVAGHWTYR